MAVKAVKTRVAPRRTPAPRRASKLKRPSKKASRKPAKATRKPARRAARKRVSTRKAQRKSAVRKSVAKRATRRAAKKVVARKVRMRKVVKKISTKKRVSRKKAKRVTRKPRRKAKRLSLRAQRNRVMRGALSKTSSGMTKEDYTMNKNGKIVSKKKNRNAKKRAQTKGSWIWCMGEARKQLNITGFAILNRGKDGIALYKRAKLLQANGGDMPGFFSRITAAVPKPPAPKSPSKSPKSVSFEVPTADNRVTRVDEGAWFNFGC